MADSQEVVLRVPALPEFLRIARVTASGLATRLGFNLDDIDDLRLALDELCYVLIGKGDDSGELELHYTLDNDAIHITGNSNRDRKAEPLTLNDFSRQILTALVDEHQVWDGDGMTHFSLTKRQATAS